ncbi:MAG: hemolysin family protein [Clostridia bacterium]
MVLAAFCTGGKAAVSRVNDYKMEELSKEGNKNAARVMKIMDHEVKIMTQLRTATITFISVICSLGVYFYTPLVAENFEGEIVPLLIVLIVHICIVTIFGELIPRKICASDSDECAMKLSWWILLCATIFRPFVFVLNLVAKLFVAIVGSDPDGEEEKVTEDDVKMMVDLGSEKGTIAPEEKELIRNIFEFGDMCADDVMTHRKDVSVLMMDESPEEWEETIRESGCSRFPVCGEDIDDIVGVVYARELYEFFYDKGDDIGEIIHQAYVVPEKISADLLFENMQKEKTHFAIVADEYGGFAGIVTMDDLLGCIVGEIKDEEYDEDAEEEREEIIPLGENVWDMDGLSLLEDVQAVTKTELPVDEFDTLSGLVLSCIEYVPDDGATIRVETCNLDIQVTQIKDRRIVRAIVRRLPDKENDD